MGLEGDDVTLGRPRSRDTGTVKGSQLGQMSFWASAASPGETPREPNTRRQHCISGEEGRACWSHQELDPGQSGGDSGGGWTPAS